MPKIADRNNRKIVLHPWRAAVRRYLNACHARHEGDIDAYIGEFEHLEGAGCWQRFFKVPRRAALNLKALGDDFELYLDAIGQLDHVPADQYAAMRCYYGARWEEAPPYTPFEHEEWVRY